MFSILSRSMIIVLLIFLPMFATAMPAHDLLQRLQSELEVLRSSTSSEYIALNPAPDVTSLIGMEKELVISVLGKPDRSSDELVYEFFHLPPGWDGGGPELVLSFSENQRVLRAQWRFSQ